MKRQPQQPLDEFIDANPGLTMDGFYWRDPVSQEFCVVVLAKKKTKSTAEEFRGDTPEALVAAVEEKGADCGDPAVVRELCEASGQWRHRSRKGRRRAAETAPSERKEPA